MRSKLLSLALALAALTTACGPGGSNSRDDVSVTATSPLVSTAATLSPVSIPMSVERQPSSLSPGLLLAGRHGVGRVDADGRFVDTYPAAIVSTTGATVVATEAAGDHTVVRFVDGWSGAEISRTNSSNSSTQ